MQSDDPSVVQPQVDVTVGQGGMIVELAFPLLSTWQWVSGVTEVTSEVSNAVVGVAMQVQLVAAVANTIDVSFDDLSLSIVSRGEQLMQARIFN